MLNITKMINNLYIFKLYNFYIKELNKLKEFIIVYKNYLSFLNLF